MDNLPTYRALTALATITGDSQLCGSLLVELYDMKPESNIDPEDAIKRFKEVEPCYPMLNSIATPNVAVSILYIDLFRRVQFQRLLFNYETVYENTLPLVEVWVNYNRSKRARFDVPREVEPALVRMLTKLQYKEQNLSFAAVLNEPAKNCALKFVELFIQ